MQRTLALLLLAAMALFGAPSLGTAESAEDILIIVNKSTPATALDLETVKILFLKRMRTWPGGEKVVPVHGKPESKLRRLFLQKVLFMSEQEEATYWQSEGIRKGLEAPPEFSNTLKAVFSLRGAIGYCFRKDYVEGVVRVVAVIPEGGTATGTR